MELNPLQTRVAQLYQEGLYASIGTWEDAQLTHDILFLFLLQEAEGCADLEVLESQVRCGQLPKKKPATCRRLNEEEGKKESHIAIPKQ